MQHIKTSHKCEASGQITFFFLRFNVSVKKMCNKREKEERPTKYRAIDVKRLHLAHQKLVIFLT